LTWWMIWKPCSNDTYFHGEIFRKADKVLQWLYINPHLIPSFVIFLVGLILLVVASILYHIRKRKVIVLSTIEVIRGYTGIEKKIFFVGIILAALGLITLLMISELLWILLF
jgi:hypothetical protein